MTEREYIKTKALGTVTAAINVVKDLIPENLKDIIQGQEHAIVLNILHEWQGRLFQQTNIRGKSEKPTK